MESFEDGSEDSYSSKGRKYQQLNTTREELHKTKEELKQAKDEAIQSWLDRRPLIDELEKLQTNLVDAKNRWGSTIISDLESQLKAIHTNIKSKKDEQVRVRTMINEMSQDSEKAREEMEKVRLDIEEDYRVRSKLKQVIKLRRQTLRTLKLTLRAMKLESEAYGASGEVALHQTSVYAQMDSNTVELTQEDYYALSRRAKEEASLAEWRVAVSIEQILVAEEARDAALRKSKELELDGALTERKIDAEIKHNENIIRETEDGVRRTRLRAQTPFSKGQTKRIAEDGHRNTSQHLRKSKGKSNRKMVSNKKKSIFVQIRALLVQKMARIFR